MRKFPAATLALAAALAFSGCAVTAPSANVSEPTEQPIEQPGQPKGTYAFGEEAVYPDDVSITVSAPEPFTPGPTAYGADQAHNVMFVLEIVNGSGENLEPVVFTRVSSGGVEGTAIFDVDQQVSGAPQTVILPGQSVTWREAWSISDPSAIVLQTSPSLRIHNYSIFTTN